MLEKEEFSQRLKEAINKKYKKQVDFADAIGASPAKLSNYVRGTAFPPIEMLPEMARVLDISLDWLCGVDKPKKAETTYRTLGDIARALVSMRIWDTVSFEEIALTETIEIDRFEGYPQYEDVTCSYPALVFKKGEIRTFVSDWQKVRKLFEDNIIDLDFYSRWINDRFQSLDKVSVDTQDKIGRALLAADDDGELTF